MIPMDQIIEMTINRSCKETGGLSRKTEDVGATERRTRIHDHMIAMREHLNNKVQKNTKLLKSYQYLTIKSSTYVKLWNERLQGDLGKYGTRVAKVG